MQLMGGVFDIYHEGSGLGSRILLSWLDLLVDVNVKIHSFNLE